jgi:hypothetical protein
MAASSRTNMSDLLRVVYPAKKIRQLFNRKRVLHARLERKKRHVDEGLEFKYASHIEGSPAGAHIPEGGTIPDIGQQRTKHMTFNMVTFLHPYGYSGQYKHTTKTLKAAAAKGVAFGVHNTLEDARDQLAIALYTPANGMRTRCRYPAVSTTQFYVTEPNRLRVGMKVCVAQIADDTVVTNGYGSPASASALYRSITAINYVTGLVTIDGALTGTTWVDDGYGISDYGVYLYDEFQAANSCFGLEDIIATNNPYGTAVGNYGGIDRTTAGNDWAKGKVFDAGNQPISHAFAEAVIETVEVNGSGEVEFWVCPFDLYREIKKLHYGDKRADYKVKVGNNWFPAAYLADRPVIPDKYCTANTLFGISPVDIEVDYAKLLDWEDDDGAMWARVSNRWEYQALLTYMYQLCACPSNHVRINNVYVDRSAINAAA